MIIIGLTGPISSGKGVLADKLVSQGYHYISLSQLVREEARKRGVEEIRDNLIDIGNDLRSKNGPGILGKLAADKVNELGLEKYVIDGIRNPGEVNILKELKNFYLVGIDAPAPIRLERAITRARISDPSESEKLKDSDKKDREIGIDECLAVSDDIIYNYNKNISDLHRELDEFMYKKDLKIKPIIRPAKEMYYWNIALAVAQRGTCLRRRFGAVIVNFDEIVSTGYVGAPRNEPNCIDLKQCFRKEHNVPPGTRYEACRSVHAEENAMLVARRRDMIGGTMYIAGQDLERGTHPIIKGHPCELCRRKIENAGLEIVKSVDAEGQVYTWHVKDWIEETKRDPYTFLVKNRYDPKK